jgi:hypothetical protein
MQGWGNLLTVIVSLAALVVAVRLLRVERGNTARATQEAREQKELRNAEQLEREAQQARTVVAERLGVGYYGAPVAGINEVKGRLGNYGNEPILDVTITVIMQWPDAPTPHVVAHRAVLAPKDAVEVGWNEAPYPDDGVQRTEREEVQKLFDIAVTFTDSEGRRWHRVGFDQPQRLDTPQLDH